MTNEVQIKPDIAISRDEAQSIIDCVIKGRTVARISAVHGGGIGAIFEIGLSGDPPSFLLKLYPETLHWKMQKEVTVSRLLHGRLSVPIPHILLADDTKSLVGLKFVLMSKLDGDILLRRDPSLTPEEVNYVYPQMGKVLRELHRIPMEAFGYIGPHGVWTAYASNRAYMSFQFEKKLTEFANHDGDCALASRLRGLVAERADLLDGCPSARLCHYDFHGGNVLVSGTGQSIHVSGILDFENAIAGDPLIDLAKVTFDYAVREDSRKREAVFAGYGHIERQNWQDTLELYRMYCVLEFWCWMAQIGNRKPLAELARDLERYL